MGYEIESAPRDEKVKTEEGEGEYTGRILYVLPGGLQSTEAMVEAREIRERDIDITQATPALILEGHAARAS